MIWHSLPASWCCRWWTFTGSWGELGWGTREHHETSQNIVKLWRNQSLQRYHMISWYILKHHETSWHLFQYSLFFLIVQGCHYNQLTFGDGRIRVESEGQIYHDMSWNIMRHHEPYFNIPCFFDSSGMLLQSTYIWRWETGEKWGSDISWYIMTYLKTSWDISLYKVISDIIRCSSSNMFWILLI